MSKPKLLVDDSVQHHELTFWAPLSVPSVGSPLNCTCVPKMNQSSPAPLCLPTFLSQSCIYCQRVDVVKQKYSNTVFFLFWLKLIERALFWKAHVLDDVWAKKIRVLSSTSIYTLVWKESSAEDRLFIPSLIYLFQLWGPFKHSQVYPWIGLLLLV